MKTAVFTIASNNYYALVKTLMKSLENSNPEYDRYVAVADLISDEIRKDVNGFEFLSIEDLELPQERKMLFRYDVLELNTAIKPFVFHTIFEKLGYDRVIYFDPDIYVYQSLSLLEHLFDEGNEIIMTPHITGIYNDFYGTPNDLDIMKTGAYNLGFFALSKSQNSLALVNWWKRKLEFQCVASFKDGLFVDQKWMDLVPGMFKHVYILKNAGYNVAYWNLTHRKATCDGDSKWFFNEEPLIFFHFSGLDPKNISKISKYQNRYTINDLSELKPLFKDYAQELLKNGYEFYRMKKYSYNYFNSGSYISVLLRKVYRSDERLIKLCGCNPFNAESIIYNNRIQIISKMMEIIWYEREDIRMIYPKINSEEYALWFLKSGYQDYGIAAGFLDGININAVINEENLIRIKVSGKYKLKMLIKRHSSVRAWNFYRKIFRSFFDKR